MRAYQEKLALDSVFPFQIQDITLGDANTHEVMHWHSSFEITCVLEGTGCYYASGQTFEVAPGDIVIFNINELHGWQVFQREMRVLAMEFSANIVAGCGDIVGWEYMRPFIERGRNFRNRIGRDELYASDIAEMMGEIRREWVDRDDGYPLMIKADVLRILTMLVRHYHDDTRAQGQHDRRRALKRLQPALEYIDANYCGRITLREAAEQVYMSPNYFSHYFHTAIDASFSDYVSLLRIRKARELLATTDKSIYEISTSCGFANNSNFYRLYKKHTGEVPSRGRNKYSKR